jgi:ATP-binding cassette subfamily B protein
VLSTRVQENVSGQRTIKAYAQEGTEMDQFAAENREMQRRSMAWAYWTAALWPLMQIGTGVSTVLVLWFGGREVVDGNMTLGEFVAFNGYLALLSWPLMSLGWSATALQTGIASWNRIAEVLNTEPTIATAPHAVAPAKIRGDVAFNGVTFGYGAEPVLRDITLEIPAGTMVAIVGATGAGKTTLVNLLARLWDPWEGSVTLDGVDLRDMPLPAVRDAVAFVPQETFLFSESLLDNIGYGRAGAAPEDLTFALETSQLANDLPQLTHGIETVIGERGVTLSGGQKQRTAIARAIIKDAPVLVLDDALSHVDTHTEEEILRRLRAFMAERTAIVVAHRTSTISAADRIVVLERGRIVETGTHAALLENNGPYARFYQRQLLAEQLAEEGEPA